MKKVSEKLDQLPIEFDPEAIWEGVDKPKRFPVHSYYILLVVCMVTLFAVIYILFNHGPKNRIAMEQDLVPTSLMPQESRYSNNSYQIKTNDLEFFNLNEAKGSIRLPENDHIQKNNSIVGKRIQTTEKSLSNTPNKTLKSTKDNEIIESKLVEFNSQKQVISQSIKEKIVRENITDLNALPTIIIPIDVNTIDLITLDETAKQNKEHSGRHSLSILGSIGLHKSKLNSSSDEQLQLRKELETPQLGYGIGVRYEYALKKNFLITAAVGYNLYKEKISTSFIIEGVDKDVLVDYDLYNHYHVFAGQVGVGKRFYQKQFFWDIQAGLGIKIYQLTEADYFVEEGILESETEVLNMYGSSPDIFFTGQFAIGKQFNNRTFVRSGLQYDSGFSLTHPSSATNHRILSFSAFVGFGYHL